MKLIIHHAHLQASERFERWIEEGLISLLPLIRIEEARIRVEFSPEASPAYRASAHLLVPGPDLRVEAVDHTPQNAIAKVLGQLKAGAMHRAARRLQRRLLTPRLIARGRAGPARN